MDGRTAVNHTPTVERQGCLTRLRLTAAVVFRGNLNKSQRNAELHRLLAATGTKRIVAASPVDRIWGIGLAADDPRALDPAQWRGTNWPGEARVPDALAAAGAS